ncbi:MAG: pantetheine-phosphate adenylyltransferase [Candidatus Adiutrix sp.]|jgi:pantetheine-phosphate adenylyltransferase|nr:pantetheine-phosphate adenylyltransferase [Candidatus Adiutrix sp.]
MTKLAVYPGSFDPPTLGHLDLLDRGLTVFDRIIMAVAANSAKSAPLFTVEERLTMLRECLESHGYAGRVEIDSFDGLLVEYAGRKKAAAILRGLRATADFEYEFQMAMVNRHLAENIQSVFFMTDYRWLYVSSTIVKEAASLGADVSAMVPPPIMPRLRQKFPGASGRAGS